jgi:hypothetical protein
MESCKGRVGKRKRKMVGLPEAVDRSPSGRAKELVVPRILHDALNILGNRRCLQMDIEAVASGKGQVGHGKAEMGRLPKAVRGSTFDRPKALVFPRVLHEELSHPSFHGL